MNQESLIPVPETLDQAELFAQLEAGAWLITANRRLARIMLGRYDQWRTGRGDRHWPTAQVMPWDAWLDRLWDEAGFSGSVAGIVPGQRQLLAAWEAVTRRDGQFWAQPHSLATDLCRSRQLARDWQLPVGDARWNAVASDDAAAFARWNRAFESWCAQRGWVAPEDRIDALCRAFPELTGCAAMLLLGFDELTPSQLRILAAAGAAGLAVTQLRFPSVNRSAGLWKARDEAAERDRMARWARHCLEQDPLATVGIVVPDLAASRDAIQHSLASILAPGTPGAGQAWNLSLGRPLRDWPMIDAAFRVFSLLDYRFDIRDAGELLRSPWIRGGQAERNSRGLLEKILRRHHPGQLGLFDLRYRALEHETRDPNGQPIAEEDQLPRPWYCPQLALQLEQLFRFRDRSTPLQPPSAWAEALDGLLGRLGWPFGDYEAPPGDALPMLEAWRESLSELASLDPVVESIGLAAALARLGEICSDRPYQPASPLARIQVLGLYEASGLQFDHLWVSGLDGGNWPPASSPDPFIPVSLQIERGMPRSSPQREFEVARTITRRLVASAGHCVFSYPGQLDGEDVMPSPLLTSLQPLRDADLATWDEPDWCQVIAAGSGPIVTAVDSPAAAHPERPRGGSRILKNQALCPFRAFAENRLTADALETPVDGVSPAQHGSLLHAALEGFWRETRDHEGLCAMDDQACRSRVARHVAEVLDQDPAMRRRKALRDLEATRLARHIQNLLMLERQRAPFRVEAVEQEVFLDLEGQRIRLIVDRIDRGPHGELLVIDYKTGKVTPVEWFRERPADPQLPLYAIAFEEIPSAVVFAVTREGECRFRGVAAADGLFPDIRPDQERPMPDTVSGWRTTLTSLMREFLGGRAQVEPRDGISTCRKSHCRLQALCRINEQFADPGEDIE